MSAPDTAVLAPRELPRPAERSVAALGDVTDPGCFGGAPWQFFEEARRQGFAQHAWSVDVGRLRPRRLAWNALGVLRGRRPGGFQFSAPGRAAAVAQIPAGLLATDIITFHQHIPPIGAVARAGGVLNFYFDATYAQLFASYGLDRTIAEQTRREAIAYEREAYAAARRIIVNQSWAFRSLVSDYGLGEEKCTIILPAANYPVFPGLRPEPAGRAGRERPFVLGFIGKDWKRKGLLFLRDVAARLRSRGWKTTVRAIGFPSDEIEAGEGMEALGFIDKRTRFGPFLHGCDVGCLFSRAEAAGTAILEFLGVGVPVAGFTVNGLADLIPDSAGLRFPEGTKPEEVADAFHRYLSDEAWQARMRAAARHLAPMLLWERCVREFRELWETGTIAAPFRLVET
jgi:glycosyltransferase involved in cell wall biosynthesis